MKILQISQVRYARLAQRGKHQTQRAEVPDSILTGITFLFHVVKPLMLILPLQPILVVFFLWKPRMVHYFGGKNTNPSHI